MRNLAQEVFQGRKLVMNEAFNQVRTYN